MKCELILQSAENQKVYALAEGSAVVGRDTNNDVQLLFEQVSRRHAKLDISAEGCTLEDLGSSNGTMVNGKKISRQGLKDGDEIKIGDCILIFRMSEESQGKKDYFVPRQYSDKSVYNTVKAKKPAGGFLKAFLQK
jgi:pSer/pThr/pTyr-binding forkhead associated (FHA) protein